MAAESSYPLQWPPGRPRTPPVKRERSNFRTTPDKARRFMLAELGRLGALRIVLSTNIPLRRDGMPYAGGYRLDDEGVAVYFDHGKRRVCLACDRWWSIGENMHAIGKTIEALRGIARWGSGDMLNSAVSGFASLPPPIVAGMKRPWREVLGVGNAPVNAASVQATWRALALKHHPDRGGSAEKMAELNAARDEALQEVGRG